MEKLTLWNMKEMIAYVKEIYPHMKTLIENSNSKRKNQKNEPIQPSIERKIRRTIQEYLYPNGTKKDSKKDSKKENDEEESQGKYTLHPIIAKIFIAYILEDYFLPNNSQKKFIRNLQQQEERLRKESDECTDEKLNQAIIEQLGEFHLAEYDDETTWSAPLPEGCTYDDETTWVSDGAYYYENTPDLNNYDNTYHIPIEPSYSSEFADKVIDRMMSRAVFDYLFEFQEEAFRRDLEERSKLIDTMEPLQVHPGFTELTEKLENPLKNYISLRDVHKKR